MIESEKDLKSENYLGNPHVVHRLLREMVGNVFKEKWKDKEEFLNKVKQETGRLIPILLGKDKEYPAPGWFAPGIIDAYVANELGINSGNPEERISGGLTRLISELLALSKVRPENWKTEVDRLTKRYSVIFSGLPVHLVKGT